MHPLRQTPRSLLPGLPPPAPARTPTSPPRHQRHFVAEQGPLDSNVRGMRRLGRGVNAGLDRLARLPRREIEASAEPRKEPLIAVRPVPSRHRRRFPLPLPL